VSVLSLNPVLPWADLGGHLQPCAAGCVYMFVCARYKNKVMYICVCMDGAQLSTQTFEFNEINEECCCLFARFRALIPRNPSDSLIRLPIY
jgi:hypothetical protein